MEPRKKKTLNFDVFLDPYKQDLTGMIITLIQLYLLIPVYMTLTYFLGHWKIQVVCSCLRVGQRGIVLVCNIISGGSRQFHFTCGAELLACCPLTSAAVVSITAFEN